MSQARSGRRLLATIFSASVAGALVAPVGAAELIPYNLPSQQRPMTQDSRAKVQRADRPVVDEAYYERFADDVRSLSPRQRGELQKSFAQSRDQALKAGRVDEAQHYARLLEIIQANQ